MTSTTSLLGYNKWGYQLRASYNGTAGRSRAAYLIILPLKARDWHIWTWVDSWNITATKHTGKDALNSIIGSRAESMNARAANRTRPVSRGWILRAPVRTLSPSRLPLSMERGTSIEVPESACNTVRKETNSRWGAAFAGGTCPRTDPSKHVAQQKCNECYTWTNSPT